MKNLENSKRPEIEIWQQFRKTQDPLHLQTSKKFRESSRVFFGARNFKKSYDFKSFFGSKKLQEILRHQEFFWKQETSRNLTTSRVFLKLKNEKS